MLRAAGPGLGTAGLGLGPTLLAPGPDQIQRDQSLVQIRHLAPGQVRHLVQKPARFAPLGVAVAPLVAARHAGLHPERRSRGRRPRGRRRREQIIHRVPSRLVRRDGERHRRRSPVGGLGGTNRRRRAEARHQRGDDGVGDARLPPAPAPTTRSVASVPAATAAAIGDATEAAVSTSSRTEAEDAEEDEPSAAASTTVPSPAEGKNAIERVVPRERHPPRVASNARRVAEHRDRLSATGVRAAIGPSAASARGRTRACVRHEPPTTRERTALLRANNARARRVRRGVARGNRRRRNRRRRDPADASRRRAKANISKAAAKSREAAAGAGAFFGSRGGPDASSTSPNRRSDRRALGNARSGRSSRDRFASARPRRRLRRRASAVASRNTRAESIGG